MDNFKNRASKTPYRLKHKKGKKKLKGLSQKKCLGGDHYLTKQEVKDGAHLCDACLKRNATYAPNAEGIAIPTRKHPENPDS